MEWNWFNLTYNRECLLFTRGSARGIKKLLSRVICAKGIGMRKMFSMSKSCSILQVSLLIQLWGVKADGVEMEAWDQQVKAIVCSLQSALPLFQQNQGQTSHRTWLLSAWDRNASLNLFVFAIQFAEREESCFHHRQAMKVQGKSRHVRQSNRTDYQNRKRRSSESQRFFQMFSVSWCCVPMPRWQNLMRQKCCWIDSLQQKLFYYF